MENWQCPIEYIDEDIRDVVRILYENNMKPYMSCSGSYKDHKGKSTIVKSACVEMLDSELTRNLAAMLINDKRFKCSISKENARKFYDNQLPTGFRFKIEFENICGDVSNELQKVLEDLVNESRPKQDDRNKIDSVCELLDTFDVSRGNVIEFSFNDEMVNPKRPEEDNYSITIRDKKDFESLKNNFGKPLDGFVQNEFESRFFANDYIMMLTFLKKIGTEYSMVPMLKHGQKPKQISDTSRIDKFMGSYGEKIELAKIELESTQTQKLLEVETINLDDLFGFFGLEDDEPDR